jgi:transcriptional regulator with XRE-family HTH domain
MTCIFGGLDVNAPHGSTAARRQRLAARRRAAGFSQEQLADHLGVERSTVIRWESGETAPQPWLRPKIARALLVSIEQLDELLDENGLSDSDTDSRLDFAQRRPASADLVTVALVRDQVQRIDERYDKAPSAALLAEAGQCLGRVNFLSANARGPVRRELYAVEAEAATLVGQLVWDASRRRDHATAHTYFDQAVSAARQLHDPAAEGLALLRKSFVVLYGERDPRAGLELATHAAETTAGVSHVLTGLAILHAAEAHAMLGQLRHCEQALSRAKAQFGQIADDDTAIELYSPTQFGRLAGSCYLFLNDARRAQPILEETASALCDRSKSQAIVLGNLALACIRQHNLDEAAARLHEAIDVIEQTMGGGGLTIVFRASRELRPWRSLPAVDEVHDRLLGLMATT